VAVCRVGSSGSSEVAQVGCSAACASQVRRESSVCVMVDRSHLVHEWVTSRARVQCEVSAEGRNAAEWKPVAAVGAVTRCPAARAVEVLPASILCIAIHKNVRAGAVSSDRWGYGLSSDCVVVVEFKLCDGSGVSVQHTAGMARGHAASHGCLRSRIHALCCTGCMKAAGSLRPWLSMPTSQPEGGE
jgi:hypothetical protein